MSQNRVGPSNNLGKLVSCFYFCEFLLVSFRLYRFHSIFKYLSSFSDMLSM